MKQKWQMHKEMEISEHKRHNDLWDEKYKYLCEELWEESRERCPDLATQWKMWQEAGGGWEFQTDEHRPATAVETELL